MRRVFQVLPDSILSFPSMEYEIAGLIGFPVIKELKELHIYQNGKMIVSTNPKKVAFKISPSQSNHCFIVTDVNRYTEFSF